MEVGCKIFPWKQDSKEVLLAFDKGATHHNMVYYGSVQLEFVYKTNIFVIL